MIIYSKFFNILFFFFQAEDGIRDGHVTGFRRVLFRSLSSRIRLARNFADTSFPITADPSELEDIHDFFKEKYGDRKSTRLNSSHVANSYAVFCLKKKKN